MRWTEMINAADAMIKKCEQKRIREYFIVLKDVVNIIIYNNITKSNHDAER